MPHRLITCAIVAFWLAMTGWLVYREVLPMLLADEVPTAQIDFTDEISSPIVGWQVFRDGKRIGSATSKITACDDRGYEFRSIYNFESLTIANLVQIKRMENVYRVTEEGKLKALSAKFGINLAREAVVALPDTIVEVKGEVIDNQLEPKILHDGKEMNLFSFGKIDMTEQGNVINPMLLVNRLKGLREGKSWRITMFDPFRGTTSKFIPKLVEQSASMPVLIAEVKVDTLVWSDSTVPCYKIEYYEPGKEVTARTWARKRDGLVLQQEANRDSFELVLKRVPN